MWDWRVFAVFLVSALCTLTRAYEFNSESCVSLNPVYRQSLREKPDSGTVIKDGEMQENTTVSEEDEYDDLEEENIEKIHELTEATDVSQYRIVTSVRKYRRNRAITVKIDGPELNGIILQARQILGSGDGSVPVLVGAFSPGSAQFVDRSRKRLFSTKSRRKKIKWLTRQDQVSGNLRMPIAYMRCVRGVKNINATIARVNTAYSTYRTAKTDLSLKWVPPPEDAGRLHFIATIVRGDRYWTNITSAPLMFNIFPPELKGCGYDRSCYRRGPAGCAALTCDVIVVTKINDTDVIFTIGGRVVQVLGYIAVGFTDDSTEMKHIDLYVCKRLLNSVDASHYTVSSLGESPQLHHEKLTGEKTDFDDSYAMIWCQFRRPLSVSIPDAADLTENVTQIVMSGMLTKNFDPILPEKSLIISFAENWNYSAITNVIHTTTSSAHPISQSHWSTILLPVLVGISRVLLV